MGASPVIVWFREDLRLADNPALSHAIASGTALVPVFIREDLAAGAPAPRAMGGAQNWWLHHSLIALAADLEALGAQLVLRTGDPFTILAELASEVQANEVVWNRRYDPGGIEVDKAVKARLRDAGLKATSTSARLIAEPWEVKTKSGGPFRVYTPFRRTMETHHRPRAPLPGPTGFTGPGRTLNSEALADWRLTPTKPDWSAGIAKAWTPGEAGARAALAQFVQRALGDYGVARDYPARPGTSRLSPHLRFGEISPHQVWHVAEQTASIRGHDEASVATFLSEILWREFSYHLLWWHPRLAEVNYQSRFDAFQWDDSPKNLEAWQRGRTGYPIVDAAMRQLRTTGWMHNRLRMIVGSFLVKHLLVHWRHGEAWFWDTLVDGDVASNPAGWQWVAGTGADAAPYFRVFNPITQGEKFDPDGAFVRSWVPELARLPDRFLNKPWDAPMEILRGAGVTPGVTYPHPIVDHKAARERALSQFSALKSVGTGGQGSATPVGRQP